MRPASLNLTILLLGLAACSSAPGTRGTIGGDMNVLTQEEIAATGRSNALEVIEYSRPQWLRARSDQSALRSGGIMVYLNETRFGDLSGLRNIASGDIVMMERYTATSASQRWGPGHSEGVIAISTRRTR